MTFKEFETTVIALAQILELENALLKDSRAREALQYLDEKTRLLMEFYKGGEHLKKNLSLIDALDPAARNDFTLKMLHVQKLSHENEGFLKIVHQQSERLLGRIVKGMRKAASPVTCYTARGSASQRYQKAGSTMTGALTLNSRI